MTDTIDSQLKAAIEGQPRKGRTPIAAGGPPGTLNRKINYSCDECGNPTDREDLFVREVTFIKLSDKRRERTRRCDWVCGNCMRKHPDFNRKRYAASPGMRDTHAKG